jgi:hypothetical protein
LPNLLDPEDNAACCGDGEVCGCAEREPGQPRRPHVTARRSEDRQDSVCRRQRGALSHEDAQLASEISHERGVREALLQ